MRSCTDNPNLLLSLIERKRRKVIYEIRGIYSLFLREARASLKSDLLHGCKSLLSLVIWEILPHRLHWKPCGNYSFGDLDLFGLKGGVWRNGMRVCRARALPRIEPNKNDFLIIDFFNLLSVQESPIAKFGDGVSYICACLLSDDLQDLSRKDG